MAILGFKGWISWKNKRENVINSKGVMESSDSVAVDEGGAAR